MAILELNTNPSTRDLRRFGALALPLACALAAAWLYGRAHAPLGAAAVAAMGAAIFVVGWRFPQALRPLFVGCMIASYPLGWLVSHLLLAAIYFLVMAPIGIGLRLMGRDPLARKLETTAESYWKPRQQSSDTARYFRQF